MAGNFDYDRKKKIQSSVGKKLAVFLLWREIFITTGKKRYITTGKKRYSCLSDGCAVLAITTGKKKVQVVIKFVLVQLELKLIQIRLFNFIISVTYKVDTYNFV